MNTTDMIRQNAMNGFHAVNKRPEPQMGMTTLIRDYYTNHQDARLNFEEVIMHTQALSRGFDDKQVRSAIARLLALKDAKTGRAKEPFLVRVGHGKGVRYALAEKFRTQKPVLQVTQEIKPAVNQVEVLRAAREAAKKRLEDLCNIRAQIEIRHHNELSPVNEEISALRKALAA